MSFEQLVPIVQMAIGPVILISGIGLLLLSMTNRLGRVIDRSRQLADSLRKAPGQQDNRITPQLLILARRARLIRLCITLATLSVLLAAMLVITIFLTALLHLHTAMLIATLFIACMGSLIGSLLVFLYDINVSLKALELEIAIPPEN
jgi:hypothetical protein